MTNTSIQKVLNLLEGVTTSGGEFKALCPSHDDSSPSLTIRERDGQILLHCHAGCKILDIMSSINLEWKDLFTDPDYDLWHEVYKDLIHLSELSSSDSNALVVRGLSEEWITLGGYRSLSNPTTRRSVIKLSELYGESLLSVPGFTRKQDQAPRIKPTKGILLPVTDTHQRVRGFQIATGGNPKYIWLSGDAQAKVTCHVPWQAQDRDRVRITEGILKADIACCVDKTTLSIGVPGTSNWSTALPVIRSLQCTEVFIAFDMDWMTNDAVKTQLAELFFALKSEGITTFIEMWDPVYKGIDDALIAGSEITIHSAIPGNKAVEGVRPASSYKTVPVEWVWKGWIPKGMLCVLEGDPSLGKSTLCADIAMRLTTCTPFPGETEKPVCGSVLFLSAEDDPGRITVPRMRAAGADLDKVYFWDFHPTFPEKLAQLEHIIEQLGIVLVVLDPFLAFLDDDIDSYKDQNIRQVLTPLSKMAERTGCAVLLIRHLNKSSAQVNKMYKGSGSIAVVAAARVCLYMLQDEDTGDRILGQVKNNLAPTQASWAFEFLEGANWQDTRLNWKGRSEL
jgi:hypothetical protein